MAQTTSTSSRSIRDATTGVPSDAALVEDVAAVLIPPRQEPADSFVLHAPLELIARAALLPYVRPSARADARRRLVELGEGYRTASPPVADPRVESFADPAAAATRLAAAIEAGDLDDVDAAARALGRSASARELGQLLAPTVIPRLGAAAHAPIFLFQLPRVAPRGQISPELLRGLVRELARVPDWRLHWLDDRSAESGSATATTPEALWDALAGIPQLGPSASDFIFPLMSRIDTDEQVSAWLGPATAADAGETETDFAARGRGVLRAAAWSMLLEPPDHAPYGWSHCLTMPQAVLGIARELPDPSQALAVAATYVAGFRASLAQRPLVADPSGFAEHRDDRPLPDAICAGPDAAAAAVWNAADSQRSEIVTELATRAASHPDAHLAKYTLACFDAAADDPRHARLFLAAAASLSGWWATIGNPDAA